MAKRGKRRRRNAQSQLNSLPVEPSRRPATSPIGFRAYLIFAVIVIATYLAYTPAFHGSFLWDDDAHVTKPELRTATGLYRIWFELGATQQYYPLLHSAFWIEHKLWGDNVLGYHLTNVLLHAAVTGLAYIVLHRLAVPGAWLAAAIFALHPVHVESVAWITEQKNTLSAMFYLAALLFYLGFDRTRQSSHYALSLAIFVMGLLTKTVIATLPAALLVIFWWQRGKLSWRQDAKPLVPFFVLGAIAGLFTAWVERNLIGAEGGEHELLLVERGLLAGRVPWFYLTKLLWPADLAFIYPRWNLDPAALWQWFFPIATLGTTAAFFWFSVRWRGPLASWLLFVGTLFPVLGFLNVYPFLFSFVANHFAYLASLAVISLAAALITLAVEQFAGLWRRLGYVFCLALVGALAIRTWQESRIYSDPATLYQTTLDRNPDSWLAHNNLGFEFAKQRHSQQAIDHYESALRLKPNYSVAHFNLANQMLTLGSLPQAIEHYQEAIAIRPAYAEAHNNLGGALIRKGDVQAAIAEFTLATQYNPRFADAWSNLGFALLNIGQTARAMDHFHRSLKVDPNFSAGHKGLADALVRNGKLQAAIPHYQNAINSRPDYADTHNSIGVALAKLGRVPEAIEHFQAAIRLASNSPADAITAYANLTRAYGQANRPTEAADTAEKAMAFARRHGQPQLAKQIEAWLTNYRAEVARSGAATMTSEPPTSTQLPATE